MPSTHHIGKQMKGLQLQGLQPLFFGLCLPQNSLSKKPLLLENACNAWVAVKTPAAICFKQDLGNTEKKLLL